MHEEYEIKNQPLKFVRTTKDNNLGVILYENDVTGISKILFCDEKGNPIVHEMLQKEFFVTETEESCNYDCFHKTNLVFSVHRHLISGVTFKYRITFRTCEGSFINHPSRLSKTICLTSGYDFKFSFATNKLRFSKLTIGVLKVTLLYKISVVPKAIVVKNLCCGYNKNMKILYVTTIGGTMGFFESLIQDLIKAGNTVDIATNEEGSKVPDCYREWSCKVFGITTSRSPFSTGNLKAIKQIRETARGYDIVHCHTPLAAMATRLACRKLRKQGLKVIYTAHGFHFYKGAPLLNWLIYYPMEKFCSRFTDTLITINKEDFDLAKRKMKAKSIEYVPGVGIDVQKFAKADVDRKAKRKELEIPEDAVVLLSVGELNQNKNHQIVIKALAKLRNVNIHYVIAGIGNQKDNLEQLAEENNVNLHLLGFRKDVDQLLKVSDVFILPSIREGLNVSVMEAMASGLPCIVSNIRGNKDMIDTNGGSLCNPLSVDDFAKAIEHEYNHLAEHGTYNARKAEMFDVKNINDRMMKIYICW